MRLKSKIWHLDKIVGIIIPDNGITIFPVGSDDLFEYEKSPESWIKLDWKKNIEFTFTFLLDINNPIKIVVRIFF